MTEQEAKQKWCPFAQSRVVRHDSAYHQVDNYVMVDARDAEKNSPSVTCLGSQCMAWRWSTEYFVPNTMTQPVKSRSSTSDGHCGLAGKP